MRGLPIAVLIGLAMISFSCKDSTKDSKNEELVEKIVEVKKNQDRYVLTKNAVYFDESNVTAKLFEVYQMLSEDLVNGDLESAKKHENILLEVIFNGEEDRWNEVEQIVKKLSEINDIDSYRVGFYDLTRELEKPFEKEITSGQIYMQYCPMAFNDKGAYWFASDKEIMNPYFGDEMLHCGSVKETFK